MFWRQDGAWRATRTPLGPATERLRQEADGTVVVDAWGPGAEWLIERAPQLLGALDDDSDFRPEHPLLGELQRRNPGLRLCRSEAVWEATLATIVEQRVQTVEAWTGWRMLLQQLGEPAPGPLPALCLPPAPEVLSRTPYHDFHPLHIERTRAEIVRQTAVVANRLEEIVKMPLDDGRRRLRAVPGLGPWSTAKIALIALGDPDAVQVGDYHFPDMVSWALAGEPRGSDARMLELLEPYRGHRARVIRLLLTAGVGAPATAPGGLSTIGPVEVADAQPVSLTCRSADCSDRGAGLRYRLLVLARLGLFPSRPRPPAAGAPAVPPGNPGTRVSCPREVETLLGGIVLPPRRGGGWEGGVFDETFDVLPDFGHPEPQHAKAHLARQRSRLAP